MDGSTRERLREITIELGHLFGEKDRLAALASRASENGQPATARRNLVRMAILDVRFDTLVRERHALMRSV
jgi:hypothetical protein